MNNFYRTKHLPEAAALLLFNLQLVKIERQGKTCWFIFDDFQKCSQISKDFFFGELMVNARDFHQSIGRLKNRIFAGA